MMKRLTFPAKYYLAALFILGVGLILVINFNLYSQGKYIQHQVHSKAHVEAQKELYSAIEHTFERIDKQLQNLADWDEVHQQLNHPSYYFYWRDQRLKESLLYQDYYLELEIYNPDYNRLAQLDKDSDKSLLPESMNDTLRYFLINPPQKDILIASMPVYSRDQSTKVIGYVSVAIDFYQAMAKENQFYYLDFSQLHFNRSGFIGLDEMQGALDFKAVSNPVSDQLWALIEEFVFQFSLASIVISLVLVWLISLLFVLPLRRLSQYLKRLSQHPNQRHPLPQNSDLIEEYQGLQNQLNAYHHALLDAQAKLTEKNQQLWLISRQDPLTELPNRRAFDESWQNLLQSHDEKPTSVGYILFDCDHFKALNDSYGHQTGDKIILESAKILKRTVKKLPVYRIGGDEFAVLLTDKTAKQVEILASECQKQLASYPFQQLGIREKVSFSLGISYIQADQPTQNLELLPKQADIAMYKAKHSPLGKMHFYQHERDMSSDALVSSQTLNKVLAAAHTGQNIQLYYQPIVSLDGQATYYETLVRLQYDDQIIYPNDIFTIVDHHGLETELDQNILKQLIEQLQNHQIMGGQGISINLSAKTLLQPFLVELFEPFLPYLKQYKLVIEITENVLINHFNQVAYALNKLRRQGFLIALDDFGSGYSSIRYLANMPVDIIKFDISLTHALEAEEKTRQIIESTAKMIRQAGYQLVMEGIETEQQLVKAKQAGATAVQGYLIGRPALEPQTPGLVL
mgnify:CR=1 FL=1